MAGIYSSLKEAYALLREIRERLIHVEAKVDGLAGGGAGTMPPQGLYQGHRDQLFGAATYAQHGDDLILLNLFDSLDIERPSYLDIGAHHPFHISNTALLYARGCRGINVDANPNLIAAFLVHRPEDINLNCGVSDTAGDMTFYMIDPTSGRNSFNREAVDEFVRQNPSFTVTEERSVPMRTVDDIVSAHCAAVFPDLLSLDVEGMEGRILRSIDYARSAPKVICVETCAFDDKKISTLLTSWGRPAISAY